MGTVAGISQATDCFSLIIIVCSLNAPPGNLVHITMVAEDGSSIVTWLTRNVTALNVM